MKFACTWLPALAGLALAGCGSTGAPGTDRIAPVKLAANAPGMIRFDTCASPVYPEEDFKRDHEGTVMLRFLLGADGLLKDARVVKSSGYASLDEAARVAISKCSFHPAVKDGKPTDAWTHVQYVWSIRKLGG